jgi:hypothetical protein
MANPILAKSYLAGTALDPSRIVMLTANDTVGLANSATAASIGISDELAIAAGQRVDVLMTGIAFVTAGAAIARGAPLTADATGRAIPAATVGNRVVGFALEDAAAAGDRIRCLISQGVL